MVQIDDVSKLRFWCHKVLPLVYDDSLSYYEVLCKVSAKLNEVIEIVNGLDEQINEAIVQYVNEVLEEWEVPLASETKNGGIRASERTSDYTAEVKIDKVTGKLYVVPYELPVAGSNLGGVKGEAKTENDTVPVHIDSEGNMYVQPSEEYNLPIADSDTLGGVKGGAKTENDTVPVHIDENGNMYVEPSGSTYVLPIADGDTLGGVIGGAKTSSDTVPVHIDTDGSMWVEAGGSDVPSISKVWDISKVMEDQELGFDDAFTYIMTNANDGDTLYIPSGSYTSVKNITITKALMIVGESGNEITVSSTGTYTADGWLKYNGFLYMDGVKIVDESNAHAQLIKSDNTVTATSPKRIYLNGCNFENTYSGSGLFGSIVAFLLLGGSDYIPKITNCIINAGTYYTVGVHIDDASGKGCDIENSVISSNSADTSNQGVGALIVRTKNNDITHNRVRVVNSNINYKRWGILLDYTYRALIEIERCAFTAYDTTHDESAIKAQLTGNTSNVIKVRKCTFDCTPNTFGCVYMATAKFIGLYHNTFIQNYNSANISVSYQSIECVDNEYLNVAGVSPAITHDISLQRTGGTNPISGGTATNPTPGISARDTYGNAHLPIKFNTTSTSCTVTLNDGWIPREDGWFPVINSDHGEFVGMCAMTANSSTLNFTFATAPSSTYGLRCTLHYKC